RFTDGVLVHDARSAALVGHVGDRRSLVLISLRDGSAQHRITLEQVRQVRLAARRGSALVLAGARRLVAVDLRFGRILFDHEAALPVTAILAEGTAAVHVEPASAPVTQGTAAAAQLGAIPALPRRRPPLPLDEATLVELMRCQRNHVAASAALAIARAWDEG